MQETTLALSLGRFASMAELSRHLQRFPKPTSKYANRIAKLAGNRWIVGYYPPLGEQRYHAVPIDDDGKRLIVQYGDRKILLWYRTKTGDPFYAYEFLESASEKPEEDLWL